MTKFRRPRQFRWRPSSSRRHFQWVARKSAYRCCSEPRPEYHGIVLHETFAILPRASPPRARLRDLGPAPALQCIYDYSPASKPPHAHAAALRQCHGGDAMARRSRRSHGGVSGTRRRPLHNWRRSMCPRARAPASRSDSKADTTRRQASLQREAVLHLAKIGDTRSMIISSASTTHRQLTDAQEDQRRRPRRRFAFDRARGQGRYHRRSRARWLRPESRRGPCVRSLAHAARDIVANERERLGAVQICSIAARHPPPHAIHAGGGSDVCSMRRLRRPAPPARWRLRPHARGERLLDHLMHQPRASSLDGAKVEPCTIASAEEFVAQWRNA